MPPNMPPPTGPGRTEQDAYATACALAARLVERHPDIADELGELLDAVKTEQRWATSRGCPVRTTGDVLADEVVAFLASQ